jgi:hypothetical protein
MFVAALVLVGAVCSTLVAAYQWSMFATRDWKIRILSTALASALAGLVLRNYSCLEVPEKNNSN